MKQGDVHIDWAISMGLFLIGITMIIVFLKPGVQPLHQEEQLLNLLERQFIYDSSWTIKKLPLYLTTITQESNADKTPKIILKSNDWTFSTCEQQTTSTSQGTLAINCGTTATITCTGTTLTCKNYVINLTYYPTEEQSEEPDFTRPICTNNDNEDLDENTNCDYTLGATEDYKGISVEKLQTLKDLDYAQLKQQWNYPEERSFALYKTLPTGEEKINGGDPFGTRNTYVREIKYWTIDEVGERTPATFSIRIW